MKYGMYNCSDPLMEEPPLASPVLLRMQPGQVFSLGRIMWLTEAFRMLTSMPLDEQRISYILKISIFLEALSARIHMALKLRRLVL